MKTNINSNPKFRSKALRLGAFALAAGIGLSSIGCNQDITKLFFTVKGKDLEVTFCDRGASIYSIKYKDTIVTYHPSNYNTFLTNGYCFGRTLGRITGRIKDGVLKVDDKKYQLQLNETGGEGHKNNSIHGGFDGLPSKDFKRKIEETEDKVVVSFNYFSPNGEAGYPEDLDTNVIYTIHKKETSQIDVKITATSSGKTPVNITTHPFFRLANEGDVLDHELEIPADKMAKFEFKDGKTNQVVIGDQSVEDDSVTKDGVHPFDFRGGKLIGRDIVKARELDTVSGGYDHIWLFNGNNKYINLKNYRTKINLHVTTDADAIIMYSNCYPHEKDEMNPSGLDKLYSGISVEPYKFFTKEDDSIEKLMITKDKGFERNISYTLSDLKF